MVKNVIDRTILIALPGAAVGVFQQVVAGKETPERLQEVVNLLRATSNPQVEYIINRVMKKWAKENRVRLE